MQESLLDDGPFKLLGPFKHRKARRVGGLSSSGRHPGPGPLGPPGRVAAEAAGTRATAQSPRQLSDMPAAGRARGPFE